MTFLTKRLGRFPLGIWVVLVILVVTGLIFTLSAQLLSFFAWDTALTLGLQEDSRYNSEVIERTIGAMSWGEAGADIVVQGTLIVLTLIGVFRRRPFGFITGMAQAIIWIYVSLLIPLQRFGFYKWGVVPDLSRAAYVGPVMILLAGIPGVLMIICLAVNRQFFGIQTSNT